MAEQRRWAVVVGGRRCSLAEVARVAWLGSVVELGQHPLAKMCTALLDAAGCNTVQCSAMATAEGGIWCDASGVSNARAKCGTRKSRQRAEQEGNSVSAVGSMCVLCCVLLILVTMLC